MKQSPDRITPTRPQPISVADRVSEGRLTLGGVLAIAVSFGFARYGYGLFLPSIRREFDMSVSMVGLIGSGTYLGYLIALLLVGVLAERCGPRLLVGIGGASAAGGIALVATTSRADLLIVGLVLAGTSPAWTWAPYSDAVDRVVPPGRRERVLAVLPAGTAVGTAVVGPAALVADGDAWRSAWLVMALLAVAAGAYNVWAVPGRVTGSTRKVRPGRPRPAWLVKPGTVPLYLTALSYGAVGAFYWYFATEAITRSAGTAAAPALFWTLMGLSGTSGMFAGHLLAHVRLRHASALLFGAIAVAVALLGLVPGSLVAAGASAVLYGPAFMAISSLLAVWSYQVFPERPTGGFSATLVFLGFGTVLGPAALGSVAERTDLRTAFLATAGIALLTLLVRPSPPTRQAS